MAITDTARAELLSAPLLPPDPNSWSPWERALSHETIHLARSSDALKRRVTEIAKDVFASSLPQAAFEHVLECALLAAVREQEPESALTIEAAWSYVLGALTRPQAGMEIDETDLQKTLSTWRVAFLKVWGKLREHLDSELLLLPSLSVPLPAKPEECLELKLVNLQYNGNTAHGIVELNGNYQLIELRKPFKAIDPAATLLRPEHLSPRDFAVDPIAEANKAHKYPEDTPLREMDVKFLLDLLSKVAVGERLTAQDAWSKYIVRAHRNGLRELNRATFGVRLAFTKAWRFVENVLDEMGDNDGDAADLFETYRR